MRFPVASSRTRNPASRIQPPTRAFARRIEHRSLQFLFEKFSVNSIRFDLVPTPRNEPIRALFREVTGDDKSEPFVLTREQFDAGHPQLHHSVQVHE